MATATLSVTECIAADPLILGAVVSSVDECLSMCETAAKCVGVSTVPGHEPAIVTGVIGVHGDVSGFITLNMAEKVAMSTVGVLLQDKVDALTSQVVDGVGELTNMIAGGIKSKLSGTPWAFNRLTVPSVIVGSNYHMAFGGGMDYVAVLFDHTNDDVVMFEDRMIQVSVSLARL